MYEDVLAALGGVHMVENSLWHDRHYDYLVHSMHAKEHGTCYKMLEGTVIVGCD
jgi:hypothetical protein